MKKSELRSIYLDRRLSLSPELQHQHSGYIARRLLEKLCLSAAARVHCYISVPDRGEVSTTDIFEWLSERRPDIVTLAPRVDLASGTIESVVYSAETSLERNRWNIPEPVGSRVVEPDEIDVAIVPLLCFDRRGHRVGYGKGYYDRLLRKCRPDCVKAGLSFFPPVDAIDDVHEGDIKLDLCVTPDRIFTFTSP